MQAAPYRGPALAWGIRNIKGIIKEDDFMIPFEMGPVTLHNFEIMF